MSTHGNRNAIHAVTKRPEEYINDFQIQQSPKLETRAVEGQGYENMYQHCCLGYSY